MKLPDYDSLYSISDIHLGGKTGFQVFNQGERLAKTINHIAASASGNTALVLNGDIADFLAEEPAKHLDPLGAISKLERITTDPAFVMVWRALKTFVATTNCHLIIVLGNHDVELALPQVQTWIKNSLAADDAARGRIQLCFDGTGFSCMVGDKRVLCVHGNEVDTWNVVDYLALIQLGRAINRDKKLPEWDANAGTRLVIGVMNNIKKRYPMIDLLKPENKAAIPTILALGPDVDALELTAKLAKVTAKRTKDTVRLETGFLAAEEELESAQEIATSKFEALEQLLSDSSLAEDTIKNTGSQLLRNAYSRFDRQSYGHEDQVALPGEEMLGVRDWWDKYFGKQSTPNRLRKVLNWLLEKDPSFDIKHKDETYVELDKITGSGIDYLIAGHTHLRRAIPRGNGYYYNSGTWIRLIRLTEQVLDDEKAFDAMFKVFESGSMESLDNHQIPGPNGKQDLVLLQPTVVHINKAGQQIYGCLYEAQPDGTLQEIPETRFPGAVK